MEWLIVGPLNGQIGAASKIAFEKGGQVSLAESVQPVQPKHNIKIDNKTVIRFFTFLPLFKAVYARQQIFFIILGRVVEHFFKEGL